jgi:phosphoribosylformylglycinamidine cyclo-ligase
MTRPSRYAGAGVDIDAGVEAVRRIRGLARSTFTDGVLSDIGTFGGLFHMEPGRFKDPVLVSSADGVGTKLRVASSRPEPGSSSPSTPASKPAIS